MNTYLWWTVAPGAARRAIWFVPFCGLVLWNAACGGLDNNLARSREPYLRPGQYFEGTKRGYQTILDRNGNMREVARIRRECTRGDEIQEGVCQDRIEYHYNPAVYEHTVRWSVHYLTDQSSRMDFADGFGALNGEIVGSVLILSGIRRLPGSPGQTEETARVQLRMLAQPGEGRPVLQIEEYSFLGIGIGRVETFWLDDT